ncbi:MAG: CoA pyrophosphatase, partial [Alphaproteobacteria bacterium]
VFEAPLDWVLAADSLRLQRRHIAGRERHFYSGTWQGFEIWGATAGMLLSLKAALDRPDESLLADSRA